MTRYSWQSYLIATASFAEWIDRGRPAPTHRRWSQYLAWVADHIGLKVIHGEVERLAVTGDRWALCTHETTVQADALMITGPGQAESRYCPETRACSQSHSSGTVPPATTGSTPSGSR